MGKILPSATQVLLKEQKSWSEFRKVLRKEDRKIFDELFAMAKYHSVAIGNSEKMFPFEAVLMAMLIEMKKEINSLKSNEK